jgi:hypothetical protein
MKNTLAIAILIAIICGSNIYAQQFTIKVADNNSTRSLDLTIGFNNSATIGIDTALGEGELPPFQPVGTGHAVLVLDLDRNAVFNDEIDMYTYKDIRPSSPIKAADTFWLAMSPWTDSRKELTFSWNWPIPEGIDSIIIIDKPSGSTIRTKVNENGKYVIKPNEFGVGPITVENFYVIVYRNKSTSSVEITAESINKSNYQAWTIMGECVGIYSDLKEAVQKLKARGNGLYILRNDFEMIKISVW